MLLIAVNVGNILGTYIDWTFEECEYVVRQFRRVHSSQWRYFR
jgi:hypothetical protein